MALDIRPLTAAELLDRTFFLYRRHFTLFIGIVVIPLLVTLLANVVYLFYTGMQSPTNASEVLSTIGRPERIILNVIQLLASLFAQGATVIAVSDVYLERPSGIGQSFARLRGKLFSTLFAMIFMGIVIGFGIIILIVPGIIFAVALSLTIPAVVIESRTPIDAMKRSWDLTRDGRRRVFAVFVLYFIVSIIVSLIFQLPGLIMETVLKFGDPSDISALPQIVTQVGNFFATCLATPLGTIASSLLYYDQRIRKEGFDLHLMVSSLESKGDGTPYPKNF